MDGGKITAFLEPQHGIILHLSLGSVIQVYWNNAFAKRIEYPFTGA